MTNYFIKFSVLLGFLVLLPIIMVCLILIYLEDGTPVIFSQKRLGKNKKIFKIHKIRTMKKGTPSRGTHQISNKNYLFIGSILRKSKIDELPQLINLLKGDINLIGPRPGLENQIKLKESRDKLNVFSVKPGITGLAQVLGFDMSNPKKLSKIDSIYINRKNIKIDIYIFFATFLKPFKQKVLEIYRNEINEVEKEYGI
tara:strand:+ start:1228 stop:1824 length:597 start_codon:yes stop_codon:yes gene_type:complete